MQVAWRGCFVVLVAAVLLPCVLAAFVSPGIQDLPTHPRAKQDSGKLAGPASLSVSAAMHIRFASAAAQALDLAQCEPNPPILQMICVRIC